LKNGVEKHGLPKMIYTDNGREFLFHDFGGNGFRKKAKARSGTVSQTASNADGKAGSDTVSKAGNVERGESETVEAPSILKQLGIEFRTALPRNARAKGIERAFKTVKETFSKLFEAYTGGNVVEKPERLKDVVKYPEKLKKVEEFKQYVDTYLAGWYNKQPHTGEGMNGKSPDEVFAEQLIEKRVITKAQAAMMFMRWSNPLTVDKNGVKLKFYGVELQYTSEELWRNYFGRKVYVRYSPDNLNEAHIYGMDEKFICTAKHDGALSYGATKDEIAEKTREKRAAVKAVKNYKKQKDIKTTDELKLIMDKAMENLSEEDKRVNVKIIKPVFGGLQKAVGCENDEIIDWTSALANLRKMKSKGD
jgi:hypothetical protein